MQVSSSAAAWPESLVAKGRELASSLSDNKWGLGDLARKVEPGDLRDFADVIGVPYNSMREYRAVADAWPTDSRLSFSYSVHQALRALPDRFEVIECRNSWTVQEARDFVSDRRSREGRSNTPGNVGIPDDGVDAHYAVQWSRVDEILQDELSDNPEVLARITKRMLVLFGGTS